MILKEVVRHMQCNRSKKERDPSTDEWLAEMQRSLVYLYVCKSNKDKRVETRRAVAVADNGRKRKGKEGGGRKRRTDAKYRKRCESG